MIRPGRSTRYNATGGTTGSDTDALQTDVMRFMSILGLCLMAVFALVQSLPLHDPDLVRAEPDRELLHKLIAVQQQRARTLAAELEQLTVRIERTKMHDTDTRQALSDARQQLRQVTDQTQQARNEQAHLKTELDNLHQQLEQGRYALAALQQAVDDRAQSLRTLEQRLDQEKKRLDVISKRGRELRMQQTRTTPAPFVRKKPAPATRPGSKGFTLRFASTEALEHQVETGAVTLYAMADKQAWRLSLRNGRPVFNNIVFPEWFHEMTASTVPFKYVRKLEDTLGRASRASVTWGVQLPPATKQGITTLTRNRTDGDLVIDADGSVSLATE